MILDEIALDDNLSTSMSALNLPALTYVCRALRAQAIRTGIRHHVVGEAIQISSPAACMTLGWLISDSYERYMPSALVAEIPALERATCLHRRIYRVFEGLAALHDWHHPFSFELRVTYPSPLRDWDHSWQPDISYDTVMNLLRAAAAAGATSIAGIYEPLEEVHTYSQHLLTGQDQIMSSDVWGNVSSLTLRGTLFFTQRGYDVLCSSLVHMAEGATNSEGLRRLHLGGDPSISWSRMASVMATCHLTQLRISGGCVEVQCLLSCLSRLDSLQQVYLGSFLVIEERDREDPDQPAENHYLCKSLSVFTCTPNVFTSLHEAHIVCPLHSITLLPQYGQGQWFWASSSISYVATFIQRAPSRAISFLVDARAYEDGLVEFLTIWESLAPTFPERRFDSVVFKVLDSTTDTDETVEVIIVHRDKKTSHVNDHTAIHDTKSHRSLLPIYRYRTNQHTSHEGGYHSRHSVCTWTGSLRSKGSSTSIQNFCRKASPDATR
jgi:hypothetical protein